MHAITKQCAGQALPVYAIPTYSDRGESGQCVGHAATYTAALALCRAAGYRVMHKGGLAEVSGPAGLESIGITVWPHRA